MTVLFTDLVGSTAPRRGARSGGRQRDALRLLRAAPRGDRAARRHRREVHRRRGDGRLRRAGRPRGRSRARRAGGARDPRLDRRGPADPHRRQHRRGARRARGASRARATRWSPATSSTRRRGSGRGAGQRDPRRRGDVPRDAARDRVPRGAAGRGEGEGRAGQGVGGGRAPGRASAATSRRNCGRRSSGASASATFSPTRSTRARTEQSAQLVTLVGVPGIGKSRLVAELFQITDADEEIISWRQGRSLPYGERVSFWALGEIVKAHAGILESDDAATAEEKLAAMVEALAEDEREREWLVRHTRPLVGLEGAERARARGGVRRLAAAARGGGRAAAARARVRGPPLGRRRAARLRRPPRRLGDDRAAAHRRHGTAGAARPATRLGRRQAQRLHALDRRALRRRDGRCSCSGCSTAPCSTPTRSRRCCGAPRATRSTPRSTRGCSPSTERRATCRCPRRCRA